MKYLDIIRNILIHGRLFEADRNGGLSEFCPKGSAWHFQNSIIPSFQSLIFSRVQIGLIFYLFAFTACPINGFAWHVSEPFDLLVTPQTTTQASTKRKTKQPERAFFGIYSTEVSGEKLKKLGFDNPYGSYVSGVIPNTGAEKAGILPFDYIYGIDEYRTGAEQNLGAILRKYEPGDKATVLLIRKGKKKTTEVTFGRRPEAPPMKKNPCEDPFLGVSQISKTASEGVKVNIVANSTASGLGMPDGAIITQINGYPIFDWEDMGIAIDMLKIGETIRVEYLEGGEKKNASGPIRSYCETKGRKPSLFDWDFDLDFDQKDKKDVIRASDMTIEIGSVSAEEAEKLKNSYQLKLSAKNNLEIDELTMAFQAEDGLLHLKFELPQRGATDIHIYNQSGRQIYEYDLGSFSGDFSDDIKLAQNGLGTYYLLIRQSGKTLSKKIKLTNK